MSKRQMANYKSLTTLIPELQDAVQTGQITATTAMGLVKKLSPEEQSKLAESISGKDKVSTKEVDAYIAEIKRLKAENDQLHKDNRLLTRNTEPKVIEKEIVREVEVVPDDYDALKNQEIAHGIADLEAFVQKYGHIEMFKEVVIALEKIRR